MKTSKKLLLIAIIVLSFSSCKIMYIPNTQNVPMLEEKGDIKVELGTKDLQVAYGVTDHLGIMVNGYYNKNDWSVTSGEYDNQYLSKRTLVEGGLGYYTTMGEKGRFLTHGIFRANSSAANLTNGTGVKVGWPGRAYFRF